MVAFWSLSKRGQSWELQWCCFRNKCALVLFLGKGWSTVWHLCIDGSLFKKQTNKGTHFPQKLFFLTNLFSNSLPSFFSSSFFQTWVPSLCWASSWRTFSVTGQEYDLSFFGQTAFVTTSQPCCCPTKADRWQRDERSWLWSSEEAPLSRGDFAF